MFQITLHKNLNGYHRVEGVESHSSIHIANKKPYTCVPSLLCSRSHLLMLDLRVVRSCNAFALSCSAIGLAGWVEVSLKWSFGWT